MVRRNQGQYAYVPNLVKNMVSPGEWTVVRLEAILPGEKDMGQPGRVDLLAPPPEEKAAPAKVKEEDGKKERRGWGWLSWGTKKK